MTSIQALPLSPCEIIKRANDVIRGYAGCVGDDVAKLGIGFDVVFEEYIYPEYEIDLVENCDLGLDESGEKVLGYFQPESNCVFIDPVLRDDPRRAFTCWHEVAGHAILQGDWLRSEIRRLGRVEGIQTTARLMSSRVEGTLEWQANLFAAHAAAPAGFVSYAIRETFGIRYPYRYDGPGRYCFALSSGTRFLQISDFAELCRCIAYYIRPWFGGLSVESLSYRVAESKYLVDVTQKSSPLDGFGLRRTAKRVRRSHRGSSGRSEFVLAAGGRP